MPVHVRVMSCPCPLQILSMLIKVNELVLDHLYVRNWNSFHYEVSVTAVAIQGGLRVEMKQNYIKKPRDQLASLVDSINLEFWRILPYYCCSIFWFKFYEQGINNEHNFTFFWFEFLLCSSYYLVCVCCFICSAIPLRMTYNILHLIVISKFLCTSTGTFSTRANRSIIPKLFEIKLA